MTQLPEKYDPAALEPAITSQWLENKAFAASADDPVAHSGVVYTTSSAETR